MKDVLQIIIIITNKIKIYKVIVKEIKAKT